jgi:hypothetical protein
VSVPLDLGWWRMRNGQRRLLTWWSDSGALTLDGPGGTDVLAVIYDEDELRRRLTGWADHCDTREGLGWLAQQLEGNR